MFIYKKEKKCEIGIFRKTKESCVNKIHFQNTAVRDAHMYTSTVCPRSSDPLYK